MQKSAQTISAWRVVQKVMIHTDIKTPTSGTGIWPEPQATWCPLLTASQQRKHDSDF